MTRIPIKEALVNADSSLILIPALCLLFNKYEDNYPFCIRHRAAFPLERRQCKRNPLKPISTPAPTQVLISLSFEKMSECKLVYKGTTLANKAMPLREIMDPNGTNEITVATKGEL